MSVKTRSQWYFGHSIDTNNFTLDVKIGAVNFECDLNAGSYTLTEFLLEAKRAIEANSPLIATFVVNRVTRIVTVTFDSTALIQPITGPRAGTSGWGLLGFTTDRATDTVHISDTVTGKVYRPQDLLRDYVPSKHKKRAISSVKNENEFQVETIVFGKVNFSEANIVHITDIEQTKHSRVEQNLNGIDDAIEFIDNITDLKRVEFMEDRDSPQVFEKQILDSTRADRDGVGFELALMYGRGVVLYYETDRMTFRILE